MSRPGDGAVRTQHAVASVRQEVSYARHRARFTEVATDGGDGAELERVQPVGSRGQLACGRLLPCIARVADLDRGKLELSRAGV